MSSRFLSLPSLLRSRKLRILPVASDGNCFYRAVSRAYYKDEEFHGLLRRTLMEHIIEETAHYTTLFDNEEKLKNLAHSNKRLNCWNSDLADIVSFGISNMLNIKIEVYRLNKDESVSKYVFGSDCGGPSICLLNVNRNHYNLLEKC
jgi:hypothetical protein